MRFDSIKFKISILYTCILAVILVIFSVVLYFISNKLSHEIDSELMSKAQAVSQSIDDYIKILNDNPKALKQAVETAIAKRPPIFKVTLFTAFWRDQNKSLNNTKYYVTFVGKINDLIAHSDNMDNDLFNAFLEDLQFPQKRALYQTLTYYKKNIRVINYPYSHAGGRYVIQVGVVEDPLIRLVYDWLYSIALGIPLVLFLTSFVGHLLAERILTPMKKISQMANKITHQDLSLRIDPKDFDLEMGEFAGSFNDMITRLEKSFKHIEEFSYNVAHELKTPLTIIRGEAELILRKDRTAEEYKRGYKVTLNNIDRILKTVEDMLLLAKLDYNPGTVKFESFDFIDFFIEICDQTRILASRKNIHFKYDIPAQKLRVNGARLHLRRLFFNIIDNAVKFTPEGGRIFLAVTSDQKGLTVTITDTGIGISEENLPRIFERYYRIESHTPGSGLGLNIARTIAKLHQGRISVESRPGQGSTFKVTLPLM